MLSRGRRIGLALSGGGIRAALFHMGVLKFLAERGRFEQITDLSTVSGASLCMSLLLSVSRFEWPSGKEFLQKVLPEMEGIMRGGDIGRTLAEWMAKEPHVSPALLLARTLEKKWGVYGNIQDVSPPLRWFINCTAFETGENFRFARDYMGEPRLGWALRPSFPIAQAAAASGAYPVLLGAYVLDTRRYQWYADREGLTSKKQEFDFCHLWDGGIYDNLGLDALFTSERGLNRDINYLIASDASAPFRNWLWTCDPVQDALRIWNITTNELDAFRTRALYDGVVTKGRGAHLRIGRSAEEIVGRSRVSPSVGARLIAECLSPEEAASVRDYPTTLDTPSRQDFYRILRHGYEVAKCVSICFGAL